MAAKKKAAGKRPSSKRELIDTGTNKLFVRRNARGSSFKEVVDVSRSPAADRRTKAKKVSPSGQGDRGDPKGSARERPTWNDALSASRGSPRAAPRSWRERFIREGATPVSPT